MLLLLSFVVGERLASCAREDPLLSLTFDSKTIRLRLNRNKSSKIRNYTYLSSYVHHIYDKYSCYIRTVLENTVEKLVQSNRTYRTIPKYDYGNGIRTSTVRYEYPFDRYARFKPLRLLRLDDRPTYFKMLWNSTCTVQVPYLLTGPVIVRAMTVGVRYQ